MAVSDPVLLGRANLSVPVSYSSFMLLGGETGPEIDAAADDPERWVLCTEHGLHAFSAANDHEATVRIEFWSAPPPEPSDSEPALRVEGRTRLAEPRIVVLGIATGWSEQVPAPFSGPLHVRVLCRGRAEAEQRSQEGDLFFDDVERWLFQLWPDGR